jgi:hypothetical protein
MFACAEKDAFNSAAVRDRFETDAERAFYRV